MRKLVIIPAVIALSVGSLFLMGKPITQTTKPSVSYGKYTEMPRVDTPTIGTLYPAPVELPVEPAPVTPAPVTPDGALKTYLSEAEIQTKYNLIVRYRVWWLIQRIRVKYPERFTADKYEASVAYIASLFNCSDADSHRSDIISAVESNFAWQ